MAGRRILLMIGSEGVRFEWNERRRVYASMSQRAAPCSLSWEDGMWTFHASDDGGVNMTCMGGPSGQGMARRGWADTGGNRLRDMQLVFLQQSQDAPRRQVAEVHRCRHRLGGAAGLCGNTIMKDRRDSASAVRLALPTPWLHAPPGPERAALAFAGARPSASAGSAGAQQQSLPARGSACPLARQPARPVGRAPAKTHTSSRRPGRRQTRKPQTPAPGRTRARTRPRTRAQPRPRP